MNGKETTEKINKINSSFIHGTIQIVMSIFWIWNFGRLFYAYHFTDLLFYYMYPDWVLFLFISMSVFGILIGLSVIFKKRKIKVGYFQLFGLLIIGLLINTIVIQ